MNLIWRVIAKLVTVNFIRCWIVNRAVKTPYRHIYSADGKDLYMGRWWLFNPYQSDGVNESLPAKITWLPSVRVHFIKRPDRDRHLHDHPWNARTIILKGYYVEQRVGGKCFFRDEGYTGIIKHGEYHQITQVHTEGTVTLFITWKKLGSWGFLVDGKKINWKEYLNV